MKKHGSLTFMIIPVKNLEYSKSRLSSHLSPLERRELTLAMLKDILCLASSINRINEAIVISDDPIILETAKCFDAKIIIETVQKGMNDAIKKGIKFCMKNHAISVLIHPVDVPLVTRRDLIRIIDLNKLPTVIIVPSKGLSGTNIMMLSPPSIIPTRYGKNSFILHIEEVLKRGFRPKILLLPNVCYDIDNPHDLISISNKKMNFYTKRFFLKMKKNKNYCKIA